jgi:diacylglycerol kinase (ATP)
VSRRTDSRPRVLWNPNAGSKPAIPKNTVEERQLRDLMARHGLGDDLVVTESAASARERTREALADGCRPIIAAGGDGTAELVAEELLETGVPLGILPLGSVMNLARSLGIPRDLEHAAHIVATCDERQIDVGAVDGGHFYECASIGLHAAIFLREDSVDGWRFKSIIRLIEVLARYRPAPITLRLDGRVVATKTLMVTVNNGPFGGLGFTFAPDARLDDGLFDVQLFRSFSKLELVRHFWSISFGRRAYAPGVETRRSAHVVVESRGKPWRADDSTGGLSPVAFRVRPGALLVIAP